MFFSASSKKAPVLADLGERDLIHLIREGLGGVNPPHPLGIGDDCAVIPVEQKRKSAVATCDSVVLGRHFTAETPANAVGRKLVNRNLSDLAAMGATEPGYALLAVVCGGGLSLDWFSDFVSGVAKAAEIEGLKVVGGDVSSAPAETFSATLSVHGYIDTPILRGGARPGDQLWVTGFLGGSILGHHLSFRPRLAEARWLAQAVQPVAMIDLTDGIEKDLPALVGSGLAAIDLEAIPLSAAAQTLSKTSGRSPLAHALCDGEDYELAFAVRDQNSAWETAWRKEFPDVAVTCIGRVIEGFDEGKSGSTLIDMRTGKPCQSLGGGYEHFR